MRVNLISLKQNYQLSRTEIESELSTSRSKLHLNSVKRLPENAKKKFTRLVYTWNEVTILWNEVTIWWNEVTKGWNEVAWNEVVMERSDRHSFLVWIT